MKFFFIYFSGFKPVGQEPFSKCLSPKIFATQDYSYEVAIKIILWLEGHPNMNNCTKSLHRKDG